MSVRRQINDILTKYEERTDKKVRDLQRENDRLKRKLHLCQLQLQARDAAASDAPAPLHHLTLTQDNGEGGTITSSVGIYTSELAACHAKERRIRQALEEEERELTSQSFDLEGLGELKGRDGDRLFIVFSTEECHGAEMGGPIEVFGTEKEAQDAVEKLLERVDDEDLEDGTSYFVRKAVVGNSTED